MSKFGSIICCWLFIFILDLGGLIDFITKVDATSESFYGQNTLTPLITKDTVALSLFGGTKMEIKNNQATYALSDHLESTRVLAEVDNLIISEPTNYTPFGDGGNSDLTFGYTGMTFEPETGTYDYHARWYDGSISRFLSIDALRQTLSPYVYVSNNPINRIDPSGNFDGLFDALDLAMTPKQISKSGYLNNHINHFNTKELKTMGFYNPIESSEATGLTSRLTRKTPLDTPLVHRLQKLHRENLPRVKAMKESLYSEIEEDGDKWTYIYRTKPEKEIRIVNEDRQVKILKDRFRINYTPNSIEFDSVYRVTDPLYYATDVVRDQYLNYVQEVGDLNNDIKYIKRLDVINVDVKDFLREHYVIRKSPKHVLLEGFLRVKGNGRSTKRILDEFNLRATDISVNYRANGNPDIIISVEPK